MANSCSVSTHSAFVDVFRPCDGTVIPVLQTVTDRPDRLPTVTVQIVNLSCPVTLIVEHQNSTIPIMRTIDPDVSISLTVDLVRNVSVECSTSPNNSCFFFVILDISNCICC
ncbi:hypothetical protein D1872_173660 [compost metagenome]